MYTSHVRDEGSYDFGVVASVNEVIRIAEEAGVRGIVSHMKCLGPDSWGLSRTLVKDLKLLQGKRTKRLSLYKAPIGDLTLDQFRAEATAFLDANASPKPAAAEFTWGQGSDDVALFEEIQPAEEARLLGEARMDPNERSDDH